MASVERRREKWRTYQAKKAATTFGTLAPVDKDERTIAGRRRLDAYLAKRDD